MFVVEYMSGLCQEEEREEEEEEEETINLKTSYCTDHKKQKQYDTTCPPVTRTCPSFSAAPLPSWSHSPFCSSCLAGNTGQ